MNTCLGNGCNLGWIVKVVIITTETCHILIHDAGWLNCSVLLFSGNSGGNVSRNLFLNILLPTPTPDTLYLWDPSYLLTWRALHLEALSLMSQLIYLCLWSWKPWISWYSISNLIPSEGVFKKDFLITVYKIIYTWATWAGVFSQYDQTNVPIVFAGC